MTDVEKVLNEFEPLFKEAVRKRLFFHNFRYGWVHPEDMRTEVENGNFQFKSKEWKLRDPQEKLQEFDEEIEKLFQTIENIKKDRATFESKLIF